MNTALKLSLATGMLISCSSALLTAATINVPGDHPTIGSAIGAASPGDTIRVADGTYMENFEVDRNLTIEAVNNRGVTVTGQGAFIAAVRVSAGDVTLRGLVIDGSPYIGINAESSGTLAIEHCDVINSGVDAGDNNRDSSGLVANPQGGLLTLNMLDSTFSNNGGRGWTLDDPGTLIINAEEVTIANNDELGIISGNPGGALSVEMNLTNVDILNNARGIIDFTPNSVVVYNGGNVSSNNSVGWQTDAVEGRNHSFTGVTFANNSETGAGLFGAGDYTFTDCILEENGFEGFNRFFNPTGAGSSITMSNSIVRNNGGSGGRFDTAEFIDITITDSVFSGNGSEGSLQVLGPGGKSLVVERTFMRQSGGLAGVVFVANGPMTLTNCLIDSGTAPHGILLVSNTGVDGGPDPAVIDFCTIVGAGGSPSGIHAAVQGGGQDDINFTLSNSILNNYTHAIELTMSDEIGTVGQPNFNETASTHNLINVDESIFLLNNMPEPSLGANTIVGANPLFVGGDDFSLTSSSPAIDAANPGTTVVQDILGNPRPFPGSDPDIGAFEFQDIVVPPSVVDSFSIF